MSSHMPRTPSSQIFKQILRPRTLSWHLQVFSTPSTPHTSILVGLDTPLRPMLRFLSFLVHENRPFLWLRLELFTVLPFLHQTVKAGCILQGCEHFFSHLLDCLCPHFRHKTYIPHCSCLCQLTSFVVALCDKLLKFATVLSYLLCAVRFHMLHFHRNFFKQKKVQFFPDFDLRMRIASSGVDTFSFTLVVDMHFDGSSHLLEKAKECRRLRPLDGAMDFQFCFQ